jgi:hypothetical protein
VRGLYSSSEKPIDAIFLAHPSLKLFCYITLAEIFFVFILQSIKERVLKGEEKQARKSKRVIQCFCYILQVARKNKHS